MKKKSGIDRKKLKTPAAREAALDELGIWLVENLLAAEGDETRARKVITKAITQFYDIRESAKQSRGIYAGPFFAIDGVGLAASDRPVPWADLRKRASKKHLQVYERVFDEVERTAK